MSVGAEYVNTLAENAFKHRPERDDELTTKLLKPVSLTDFLAVVLPPRELLLDPWLPEQGLTMVYAQRGVGKTFFCLNVAYAVATGGEYLGWGAKRAPVLYLDGEMPATALQERLAAIALSNPAETADLRILTPDLQEFSMPDLATADGQAQIEAVLDDARLIVVDNISTLCRSGRENEAESWLSVQGWGLRMRAQGRSVLFVHHSGKGGQQRGTSRREDVLDTVINLRQPIDYDPQLGAQFEINFTKARGFYGDDAEPLEARLETTPNGLQAWSVNSLTESTYKRVVGLYGEGLSQSEIARDLDLNRSTINRHIKKAEANGEVIRRKS